MMEKYYGKEMKICKYLFQYLMLTYIGMYIIM